MKKIFVTKGFNSENFCREYPDCIFIFGDNLIGKGYGGQAIIRDEPNVLGIPTKRLPSMSEDSFFSDRPDEKEAIDLAMRIIKAANEEFDIIFPSTGVGTGLAKMKEKSPNLFWYMNQRLLQEFGFDNESGYLV